MKLKISRTALVNGLQMTTGVVGSRTTLAIISNVLLKAEKDRFCMTATDIEVSVRCTEAAEVETEGATTLPARRLTGIVKELPAEDVEIDVDDKHGAAIRCGPSFFKVLGQSDDEFPPLPDFQGKFAFTMDQLALKTMLRNVSYGASTDESRHVLNGVFMSFMGDKLTVVATDGRRLALAEHDVEFPKEEETEMIVPTKAVNELLQALKDEGQVKIYAAGNHAIFEFGNVLVTSKMIEGDYPNFRQVIPEHSTERISLERETLLNAVRRVALLTTEKSSSIRLTFGKNKLKVSVVTPEVGEANETMSIKYTGKEFAVAFNPDFLMDPLRHLTNDEVFLELTDELSPGVIKCDNPFLYVLMPMRLS